MKLPLLLGVLGRAHAIGLTPAQWLAVLRIGLGLWWLESWRHKNKRAWFEDGAGIKWAKSVADKHRFAAVTRAFGRFVAPHERLMSYVVVSSELAVGLGLVAGFLTPVALVGGLLLNLMYFVLMIHDWAEQGQNSMMALISVVCLLAQANQAWSLDSVLHLLGG